MKVGDNDFGDRLAAEKRQNLTPQILGGAGGDAGVHDRPTFAVRPDVDVIQLERQGQTNPMDARGDLDGLSWFRLGRERIFEAVALARGRGLRSV
jgi:hypothetical protein